MRKFFSRIQFIFKKRWYILIGLFILIGVGFFVAKTNAALPPNPTLSWDQELTWWAKWLDPIIGTGIFLLTLVIGWTQLDEDWEESLEKRLTVIFRYNGREVMICKKAHLTAEGDIRQLGQQIGQQMSGIRFLDFKANDIESKRLGVFRNEFKKGKYFVHHQVEFELTKLPTPKFETHNLIWHEPDNTVIEQKEEWIKLPTNEEETPND